MFLWNFKNRLQQKQSSFSVAPAIQSSSLSLPPSSLLLSKSSCDFPGLSASPSWGLNLLLQIPLPPTGIFSSAKLHHLHSSAGWPGTYPWQHPQLVVQASICVWDGYGRLSIAFWLLQPQFSCMVAHTLFHSDSANASKSYLSTQSGDVV